MGCNHSQSISDSSPAFRITNVTQSIIEPPKHNRQRHNTSIKSASCHKRSVLIKQHYNYFRQDSRDQTRILFRNMNSAPCTLPIISKWAQRLTEANAQKSVPTITQNGEPETLARLCLRVVCQNRQNWVGTGVDKSAKFSQFPQHLVRELFEMMVDHRLLHGTLLKCFHGCHIPVVGLGGYPAVSDSWLRDIIQYKGIRELDLSGARDLGDEAVRSIACLGYGNGSVNTLRLVGCKQLTDASVALVVHSLSGTLESLSVAGCVKLTDSTLSRIIECRHLRSCALDRCKQFTQAYLCQLGLLTQLETLTLNMCSNVDDYVIKAFTPATGMAGIEGIVEAISNSLFAAHGKSSNVAISETVYSKRTLRDKTVLLESRASTQQETGLRKVQRLEVGWTNVTDKSCSVLSELHDLRHLVVSSCKLSNSGFSKLSTLPKLEHFEARYCNHRSDLDLCSFDNLHELQTLYLDYTPVARVFKGKMENLKQLSLSYAEISDVVLPNVSELAPNLELLRLEGIRLTTMMIRHVSQLRNLTTLDLCDTRLSDTELLPLKALRKLKNLNVSHSKLSCRGVKVLTSHLFNLEELCLDSISISNDSLRYVKFLPKLVKLDLFGCFEITDEGLRHVAEMQTLRCLIVCGGKVKDRGIGYLSNLESLTSLNISQNEGVTDEGLRIISEKMPALQKLNISHTGVTAAGVVFLCGLTRLEELSARGLKKPLDCSAIAKVLSEVPRLWHILA